MCDWTSVKDQLPKNKSACIVSMSGAELIGIYGSMPADFQDGKFWDVFNIYTGREMKFVTHWMPPPKPPTLSNKACSGQGQ